MAAPVSDLGTSLKLPIRSVPHDHLQDSSTQTGSSRCAQVPQDGRCRQLCAEQPATSLCIVPSGNYVHRQCCSIVQVILVQNSPTCGLISGHLGSYHTDQVVPSLHIALDGVYFLVHWASRLCVLSAEEDFVS